MADGLGGWYRDGAYFKGKVAAIDLCNSCDLFDFKEGTGIDHPCACRARGNCAAADMADNHTAKKCKSYEEKTASNVKKGGGLGGFLKGKVKDLVNEDVKSFKRQLFK